MSLSNEQPIDFEVDLDALPVVGQLPAGLQGVLVRNGPNPVNPQPGSHWFTGDGMLHAFYFENGNVNYSNRWVRTQHFLAETQDEVHQGKNLSQKVADGAANTNFIHHAGHYLALEEAHLPVAIDISDLSTLGQVAFDTTMTRRMTAHPKILPAKGSLIYFAYGTPESFSNQAVYGQIDRTGHAVQEEVFTMPYPSMVHDFAITENYVLFPLFPLTASAERAKKGYPPFAWEPELGMYLGIMSIAEGVKSLQWIPGDACFSFHIMNAWEEGDVIRLDLMQYETPPLFPWPDGTPVNNGEAEGRFFRWSVNHNDAEPHLTCQQLSDVSGEFPRIDERFTGKPYRHGWFSANKTKGHAVSLLSGLAHYDNTAGLTRTWFWNEQVSVSEGVFVPASSDAGEGEGWIMATVWFASKNSSELAIFDALNVDQGPLARVILPHRIPDGFHGNWFNKP